MDGAWTCLHNAHIWYIYWVLLPHQNLQSRSIYKERFKNNAEHIFSLLYSGPGAGSNINICQSARIYIYIYMYIQSRYIGMRCGQNLLQLPSKLRGHPFFFSGGPIVFCARSWPKLFFFAGVGYNLFSQCYSPENYVSPENGWFEDVFPTEIAPSFPTENVSGQFIINP